MIHGITLSLVCVAIILQIVSLKLLVHTLRHVYTIARDPLTPESVAKYLDPQTPSPTSS